jgi:hypothetical protein
VSASPALETGAARHVCAVDMFAFRRDSDMLSHRQGFEMGVGVGMFLIIWHGFCCKLFATSRRSPEFGETLS